MRCAEAGGRASGLPCRVLGSVCLSARRPRRCAWHAAGAAAYAGALTRCLCARAAQPATPVDAAVEDLPSADAKPEDALVFFQQQTSTMDREALLARVAEAAAKEADAVTKLGQLTCVRGASREHAG